MSDELTFAFTLDPAEQVRVANLAAKRTPGARLWRWVGLPFLAVPVACAIVFDWPLRILWPYAIVLLIAGALGLAAPVLQRWQARRALANAPDLRTLTYRFTDAGIVLTTPLTSATLAWEGVQEAAETDDMFVLFYRGNMTYYVPKRAVGDQGVELAAYLRARLGARARGLHSAFSAPVT